MTSAIIAAAAAGPSGSTPASSVASPADLRLINKSPEAKFVDATIGFESELTAASSDPSQTVMAVRAYLEGGGLRAEIKPESERRFSSILRIPNNPGGGPYQLVTGSKVEIDGNSQRTVPTTVNLEPGLYRFDYNTENSLTLQNLNDPQDAVQTVLGGTPGANVQLNATLVERNAEVLATAIQATSALYKQNREEAVLAEVLVSELYGENTSGIQTSMTVSAQQNPRALAVAKDAVSDVLGKVDAATEASWKQNIHDMVRGKPSFTNDHPLLGMIEDELDLQGDPAELRVGISVSDDSFRFTLLNPSHYDQQGHSARPSVLIELEEPFTAGFSSSNSQTEKTSWQLSLPPYPRDYDNATIASEQATEAALAAATSGGTNAQHIYAIQATGGGLGTYLMKEFRGN